MVINVYINGHFIYFIGWGIWSVVGNKIRGYVGSTYNGDGTVLLSSVILPLNTWEMVALVKDGTNLSLYVGDV